MLKVTIASGDGSYTAVVAHDDKKKAAEDFLALLKAEVGFFPENRIDTEFPSDISPGPDTYGAVLMPDQNIDEDGHRDDIWWVYVSQYITGTPI